MKIYTCLLFFFLLTFSPIFNQNDSQPLFLESVNAKQGFPDINVFDIIQDRHGFLWFTSQNGLIRYDGIQTQVYCHYQNPDDPEAILPECSFTQLQEDNFGDLWTLGWNPEKNQDNSYILLRFDRSSESFESYGSRMEIPAISNILTKPFNFYIEHNTLWLWTEGRLLQIRDFRNVETGRINSNPKIRLFEELPGVQEDKWGIRDAKVDGAGRLCMTSSQGLLIWNHTRDTFDLYRPKPGSTLEFGNNLANISIAPQGKYWLSGWDALYSFDPESREFQTEYHFNEARLRMVFARNDQKIWVSEQGGFGGLQQYDTQAKKLTRFKPKATRSQLNEGTSFFRVKDFLRDRSGVIWISTSLTGLFKYGPESNHFKWLVHHPADENSIGRGLVSGVSEGSRGTYWIGTVGSGLNRWDRINNQWERNVLREFNARLPKNGLEVLDVQTGRAGEVWAMIAISGVARYNPVNSTFEYYESADPSSNKLLGGGVVLGISRHRDGTISVGTGNGWHHYDAGTNSFSRSVKVLNLDKVYEDDQGFFWLGPATGLYGGFYRYDPTLDSLYYFDISTANTFWEDKKYIWAGSLYHGVLRIDKQSLTVKKYDEQSGLPHNHVVHLEGDNRGRLWMATAHGFARFDPETESFRNYDETDGFHSRRFLQNGTKDADGELFFPSHDGLLYFHPDSIVDNATPPEIAFTDIELFGHSIPIGRDSPLKEAISVTRKITFKYWQNDLTFHFAALHYKNAERNRYQVLLENYDPTWRSIDHSRAATYTSLDPGHYTFRVKASNSDGIWNEEGIALNLIILPPWWLTWWARALYVVAAVGAVFGYLQWRTFSLRKRQQELETTVTERTAEVVAEKERSEELLLNILPQETAEELKQYGSAKAKNYDMVTVLFTDFQDFSAFARRCSPEELVAEIDYCYKAFDHIMTKYNVEKIKTIGDSYMAAAGLPTPTTSNPEDAVRAALSVRDFMAQYQAERLAKGKDALQIRIGVHTGPVVAGIVGIKKFAYDIWGDTVNTAARMESNSYVGKVNVSQSTFKLLEHSSEFSFEPRGKIEAKGIGMIDMYFVE